MREADQVDREYVERFMALRNRITERLEERRLTRWLTTGISRALHPACFGLRIRDGSRLLLEGTMYTRGNYYDRFGKGIAPECRWIFQLEKSSVDELLARGEEVVANPFKVYIMGKKSSMKWNRRAG